MLLLQNQRWLSRMAFRYTRNAEDAADLLGETNLKILRAAEHYDTIRSFRSWSLKIMQNTFIDMYHRQRKIAFVGYEEAISEADGVRTDQKITVQQIEAIVEACARQHRGVECVNLYAQGYSYEEIGQMVGVCTGTVKSRIRDARRLIFRALMADNINYPA